MRHGEGQGVDPLEIAGVQGVLGAHAGGERGAEIAADHRNQGIQGGDAGHVDLAAASLELGAQVLVDDGVEHDPGRSGDLLQHPLQLLG